jgi:protein-S-isoprenylcysteine O-methyltransferase Ste14
VEAGLAVADALAFFPERDSAIDIGKSKDDQQGVPFMLPSLLTAIVIHRYFPPIAALPHGLSLIKPVGYLLLLPGPLLWVSGVLQSLAGCPKDRRFTTGAYGIVRNPIYSRVTVFILPAIAFVTLTWVYFVPAVFLYAGMMRFIGEGEKQLTRAFGKEYEAYVARVDRLIPFRTTVTAGRYCSMRT